MRQTTSTMRPRSGKEYQNIDRSMLSLHNSHNMHQHILSNLQPSQMRSLMNCSVNYANITPVPENVESPSPGYLSGGSPQEMLMEPNANLFNYKVSFSSFLLTIRIILNPFLIPTRTNLTCPLN